ncbi:MAG: SMP-30/gluconolactonase/LRE family protein [Agrobacterium vaccinii]
MRGHRSTSGSYPVYKAERIAGSVCILGESPVWDPSSSTVTWLDNACSRVHQFHLPAGEVKAFQLPLKPGALALISGGRFITSTDKGFARITIDQDNAEVEFGTGPQLSSGWRMNDGGCDRQGRFWSGSMAPDTSAPDGFGTLFSIDGEGRVVERGGRYRTQNGLAWSLDGRTMYVSDSYPSNPHVMAYDFDGDSGDLSNGRLFADQSLLGGRPDGAAVDADGCYWIAASDSGKVLRLTPDGKVDAAIEVDAPNPTNLCFIGPDLDTVFITTLKQGGTGPGGETYMARIPHRGASEPVFSDAALPAFPHTNPGFRLADSVCADPNLAAY